MSNYYYNEKKGRYEPISEAPFGIVPREKRDRKVFTAQDYERMSADRAAYDFERLNDRFDMDISSEARYRKPIETAETPAQQRPQTSGTKTNPYGELFGFPVRETIDMFSKGNSPFAPQNQGGETPVKNMTQKSPYSSQSKNSTSAQKRKASLVFLGVFVWIVISAIRACSGGN